jgi:hypothetical protein
MTVRDLLRGAVRDDDLEQVATELADRYDRDTVTLEPLDADNWLSIPCVAADEWFVKIITPQHSLVHALLTTGRNIGAFSSGTEGFFEHVEGPVAMAEHEFEATRRLREIGVTAPRPVEAFGVGRLGVLVLEYLPEFTPFDALDPAVVEPLAADVFATLARMHEHRLAHGDLRAENLLLVDGDVVVIDATSVRADAIEDARAYDIACGLGVLEPFVGARRAVAAAGEQYTTDQLLDAGDFLDFVSVRPDHDFDAGALKAEIDRWAARPN